MHPLRLTAVLVVFMSALTLASARGDHESDKGPPRGRRPVGRVIFYENADFRGPSIIVLAGERILNLTGERFSNGARANDRISSFRIEGDVEVLAYRDADFRGDAVRFTRDVRNLTRVDGRWNDAISSIKVQTVPHREGR